ncbi:flavin reductase [Ruegeria sp. 2012CJ41-6]|uniref:Flavin reductase n=1 Tax=Ruegeria spongiae TaxID=2942209 RepID=A0ABT0Q882_9RHOB|nr:flavin reductase [Ruegeria spongiae]MCL6286089.1 flavin reductase [Ruegeria spongiae]
MSDLNFSDESVCRQLRKAFGSFTTGVTVVTTTNAKGEPIGFTANSFTSVSLNPPLLLVCLAKSSSNIGNFARSSRFAVNILSEAQQDISGQFASRVEDRFASVAWHKSANGSPLIDDCVAWFDCVTHEFVDAGDHVILIGRIDSFCETELRPLAYLRGHYLDLGLGERAVGEVTSHGGVRLGAVITYQDQLILTKSDDGWALPMGNVQSSFREGRAELEATLLESGITAELGFLYSVFDAPEGDTTWMIFLGHADHVQPTDHTALFQFDEIPFDAIAIRQLRSVLRRFQSEFKQSRFGLYVDDTHASGRINPIETNATTWKTFLSEQEKGA